MVLTQFAEILGLGTPELIVILAIILLLFGGSKLPQLSRSLGSSMKELRKGMESGFDDDQKKSQTTNNNSDRQS